MTDPTDPTEAPAVDAVAADDADAAAPESAATESAADQVDGAGDGSSGVSSELPSVEISEEAVVALITERDDYLDRLQRLKAEFTNFRRRTDEGAGELRRQAAADLVEKLLPVLDSCDAAVAQGVDEVKPVQSALFEVLAGQGLARMETTGAPFDPEHHEAVLHEPGDAESPIVAETLRAGYLYNERVIRPAMVKVKG